MALAGPVSRTGPTSKRETARSRLYRRRFLQVNTRWKALAEIYTMHSFAPFSKLRFLFKYRSNFAKIEGPSLTVTLFFLNVKAHRAQPGPTDIRFMIFFLIDFATSIFAISESRGPPR